MTNAVTPSLDPASASGRFAPSVLRLALLAGLLLAGCTRSAPPTTGPAPLQQLRFGYFANLSHAQAVLGVASGDFARVIAPARLVTRVFNAGPSLVEALFAGELDVGYVGPSPALNAFVQSRGQGIRVIAGASANAVVIVARANSGIRTLADLKGRRVATPQLGNTQDVSARHYLLKTLGQPDVHNVLPIPNAEQAGMMVRGQIDAAWVPEPWGARLVAEAGGKIIAEEKDLWPGGQFGLAIVVTTPEFLAAHPDALRRALSVHLDWTRRLTADPDKCTAQLGDALATLTGKRLPPGILADAMKRTRFLADPLPDTFPIFAQWAFDVGFSKTVPDLTGLVDTAILQSVQTAQP